MMGFQPDEIPLVDKWDETRQLLLCLEKWDETKKDALPAERLLRCLKYIALSQRRWRWSAKLQRLVHDVLANRQVEANEKLAPSDSTPVLYRNGSDEQLNQSLTARQKFWTAYKAPEGAVVAKEKPKVVIPEYGKGMARRTVLDCGEVDSDPPDAISPVSEPTVQIVLTEQNRSLRILERPFSQVYSKSRSLTSREDFARATRQYSRFPTINVSSPQRSYTSTDIPSRKEIVATPFERIKKCFSVKIAPTPRKLRKTRSVPTIKKVSESCQEFAEEVAAATLEHASGFDISTYCQDSLHTVHNEIRHLPTLGPRHTQLTLDEALGKRISGFGEKEENKWDPEISVSSNEFDDFVDFIREKCASELKLKVSFPSTGEPIKFKEFEKSLQDLGFVGDGDIASRLFDTIDVCKEGRIDQATIRAIWAGEVKISDPQLLSKAFVFTSLRMGRWGRRAVMMVKGQASNKVVLKKPDKTATVRQGGAKVVANSAHHQFFEQSESGGVPDVPRWLYDENVRALRIVDKNEQTFTPQFSALVHSPKVRQIESASFTRCSLPASLFAQATPKLKNLQHLELVDCHLAIDVLKALDDLSITTIDFSCSRIANNSSEDWEVLFVTLNTLSLTHVCLHGTFLAYCCQDVLKSAALLSLTSNITSLDLSNNYLRKEAYGYLGDIIARAQCNLGALDLSHMATCFHGEDNLGFMERLRDNKSLRRLTIRGAQCGFAHDVVLEDALGRRASNLQELDLGDNPHGAHGLRALFRLYSHNKVKKLILDSVRDAPEPTHSFSYQGVRKEVKFSLAEPQARALYRLYHTVPHITLTNTTLNGKPGAASIDAVDGMVSFTAVPSEDVVDSTVSSAEFLTRAHSARKLKVTLKKFAALCRILQGMQTEAEITLFVRAISEDFALDLSHIHLLVTSPPLEPNRTALIPTVCRMLLPCVCENSFTGLVTLLDRILPRRQVLTKCCSLFAFSPENPTGNYRLDLSNPVDLSISSRMILLDKWHSYMAMTRERLPDVSQYGNRSCLRNVRYQRTHFKESTALLEEALCTAPIGELSFDFSSPLRLSREPTDIGYLQAICRILVPYSLTSITRAMRQLAPQLVFSAQGIKEILEVLPSNVEENPEPPSDGSESEAPESKPSTADSFAPRNYSANPDSARVEVFVTLFPRCVDNPLLLSTVLYNKVFHEREMSAIRHRLGKLQVYDGMNCERREKNGNGFSHGNRMSLSLSVWEEYRLFSFILKLRVPENGAFTRVFYVNGEGECVKDFEIPAEWETEIPREGSITVTYSCESVKRDIRWSMGKNILAWHNGEKPN